MRIHANEKPFNCKLCNYRSTRACHMIVHMRTHTGEKPYRCELCDYRSAQIAHKKIPLKKLLSASYVITVLPINNP